MERTVVGKGSGESDEEIAKMTEHHKTDNNATDNFVDEIEVVGEGTTEEEERGSEHEWYAFHHKVELPGDHSVHLALPVSASFSDGSTPLRGIAVQPLLSQHRDEGSEEGSRQTRVEDSLDMDDGGIGAIPLGESGVGASWDVPERSTGDNLEEGVVHLLEIRFELSLNVDDESGCNRGEQTSLFPSVSRCNSHKGRGVCGKMLTKINVVFKSSSYFLVKSRS